MNKQMKIPKKFSVKWVDLLSSAGRSFGSIERVAQCPHDSGTASGIFAHLFSGFVVVATLKH